MPSDQFRAAGLDVFTNNWSAIFDFNAKDGKHWDFVGDNVVVATLLPAFVSHAQQLGQPTGRALVAPQVAAVAPESAESRLLAALDMAAAETVATRGEAGGDAALSLDDDLDVPAPARGAAYTVEDTVGSQPSRAATDILVPWTLGSRPVPAGNVRASLCVGLCLMLIVELRCDRACEGRSGSAQLVPRRILSCTLLGG